MLNNINNNISNNMDNMNNINNNILNNMLNNHINPMNNNMISIPSKMEIIMHLMNQNTFMQNQIEMNNQLIFKLFQDNYPIPNINNLSQNNNPNFQNINNFNMQNNLNNNNSNESNNTEDFPGYFGRRLAISFNTTIGTKIPMNPPENIKISELLSKFMKKMKLNENLIDDKIYFLFNGFRLKKDDQRKISELGISNTSKIIVLDLNNTIGG